MAISTVTNRVELQGNGTSAVFAFPYRFHAQSDLAVFVYNSSLAAANVVAAKVLNTDYTVSATANASGVYPNGGNIVFNSTPNSQSVIVVFRSSVVTNAFTVGQNGAIPSSGLNNEIDYLTIIAQRLQDQITRGVRLADGFSGTFDPTLPPTLARAGSSSLMVNGAGTGLVMGPTADQIFGAASSAVAAAASASGAATSASNASASATLANSAAVSAGNQQVLVNSAFNSISNAVSLIGSTAFWGATAQSSALSATNQAVLAGSAAVSAGAQAAIASSSALSASNNATLAGSAALSASNSAALAVNPMTASGDLIVGSGAIGAASRLAVGSGEQVLMVNSGFNLPAWVHVYQPVFSTYISNRVMTQSSANMAFSATFVDSHGGNNDVAAGSSLYVVQRAGRYLLSFAGTIGAGVTGGGTGFVNLMRNGTQIQGNLVSTGLATGGQNYAISGQLMQNCSSGHTVGVQAYNNTGSNSFLSGSFNVQRV